MRPKTYHVALAVKAAVGGRAVADVDARHLLIADQPGAKNLVRPPAA